MSEYQYYEFQAIDRPLDKAAQEALRSISSRARITATSFTNHYEWGDLKGDPRKFMEQWFDLHLYLANWGTRRLMMRVPKRFLSRVNVDPFLREVDWVDVLISGGDVIVDIHRDEVEASDDWDDGSGRLAALAPLRADVLSGDLRVFYLLWLTAVQDELISDDEIEPLPGIGPLTGALEAFAEFFYIDRELVQAAAESCLGDEPISKDTLREALAAIAEDEKTELMLRVVEGDSHVAAEFRSRVRDKRRAPPSASRRTVAELRRRAQEIGRRANARRPSAERRSSAGKLRKPKARAVNGSRRSSSAVLAFEARLRRKSNAATPPATTERQVCSPIYRRWPLRREAKLTSGAASPLSGTGMRRRENSSRG